MSGPITSSLPNAKPPVIEVSESEVVYGPLTRSEAYNFDKEIQEITAEVKSAGIKYTLAILLPSFILKLWSKISGSEVLPNTDLYANYMAEKSALLMAKYVHKYLPNLDGQNDGFINKTGDSLVNISGKFLAGYVANQGWEEINKLADFYLDQLLGKGLMGMVVRPLASRVVGTLQKDFEKRWDVKGLHSSVESLSLPSFGEEAADLDKEWVVARRRGENYLADFASTTRDALISLIDQFDIDVFMQTKPGEEIDKGKLEFLNSLKDAGKGFLQSPTFSQFIMGGVIGEGLNNENLGLLHQYIEGFVPNFAPEKDSKGNYITPPQIKNFVVSVVDHVNAQTKKETTALWGSSQSIDVVEDMANFGKKFLKDYLEKSQWDYLDKMVDSSLSGQTSAVQVLVKQVWAEIKLDIESYINTDMPPENNTVSQLFSIIKEFAGGYIAKAGWEAIDDFVMPNHSQDLTQTYTPLSQLSDRAKQRTWNQTKRLIDAFLGVKSIASTENTKTTKSSASLLRKITRLVSQVLNKPGVADAINNITEPTKQPVEESESLVSTKIVIQQRAIAQLINLVVGGVQQMTKEDTQGWDIASMTSWLKKGTAIKGGETIAAVLRSYLSGQSFVTLDQYIDASLDTQITSLIEKQVKLIDSTLPAMEQTQIAKNQVKEIRQLNSKHTLIRELWAHTKSQLTAELFDSQAIFDRQFTANKESAESVLLDEIVRNALGLASERQLGKIGYAKKAGVVLGKAVINTTLPIVESVAVATVGPAITNLAVGITKMAASKIHNTASIPLSYVVGSLKNWWGGN